MLFDLAFLGGGIFLGIQFGAFFEKQWGYATAIANTVAGFFKPKAAAKAATPTVSAPPAPPATPKQ